MNRVLKTVYAMWYRDSVRFVRDRSRWLGMFTQPVLYLLLVGTGIASSMKFRAAPGNVDYLAFMFPGIVGMSVLFTAIFSAVGIIWDREFGFLKEVLVAPVPRWAAALGKALGIATVIAAQTLVLLFLAPLAHVPITVLGGLEALAIAVLMGFCIGWLGIAIASKLQSMEGFQFVMNLLTMPMFFLSGALYPLKGLPTWLMALARIDPLTYGVDALRWALLGDAAGPLVQLPLAADVGLVALITVAFALVGAWSFERQ